MTVLNLQAVPSRLFFAEDGIGIARYDKPRYPELQKLNKQMRAKFWEPETVSMSQERRSFNSMTDAEQFVFTANIQRPTILDTIQGRAPVHVFGTVCTDPTLENCITTWQFFESIHSESYTHIERAVWSDPSKVVDAIPNIQSLIDCTASINRAYDNMLKNPTKENLYLALISANALEGIRFQMTFTFMFNFKHQAKMPGSGDIFKYIARDESLHFRFTDTLIRLLTKDDPDFVQIIADNREKAVAIYQEAYEEELSWGEYSFSQGPIMGLTIDSCRMQLDHLKNKQMRKVGLTTAAPIQAPLQFLAQYMDEDKRNNVQVAPQEDGSIPYLSATTLTNDLDDFVPVM